MDRRKGAAWTCLPCYQCQSGKLFAPSMLPSQNGRLRQLHWQGVAEKGQVHLLPPAMHRMLDAGMQFVPRQRRLPRWTGSGQAPTPPKPPQPPKPPPSLLQQPPIHLAPSPKPSSDSVAIAPREPGNPFNADRSRCARLSFVHRPGPVLVGLQGAGPRISDLVPGPVPAPA